MSEHFGDDKEDEMLMALADGELDGPEAERLMARIERDPALAERYAMFTRTAEALREALTPGDVPPHLVAMVRNAPADTAPGALPEAPRGTILPFPGRATWPAALAASLLLGLGIGWGLGGPGGTERGGTPVTAMGLPSVADLMSDVPTGGSRDLAGTGTARVIGSFETGRGFCRLIATAPGPATEATSDAAPAQRFVACREGAEWQVAISVVEGGGYAPASAAASQTIDLYLDAIGAGPALTPEAEAGLMRP